MGRRRMSSRIPHLDPVIPPSRLYMYFYHEKMPPWGISWDFIRNSPHLLLVADVQVDKHAQDAEEYSRKSMGWLSGEIHRILRKKNVIRPHDFEETIRPIAEQNQQMRTEVRARIDAIAPKVASSIDSFPEKPEKDPLRLLFKELSDIDYELLPVVCGEPRSEFDFLLGLDSSPQWASRAEQALSLFLNPEFKLLPDISDLSKEKQQTMRKCFAGVSKVQRKPLFKLATGVYDYRAYQDELVSLGERKDYDYLIDATMASYEDPKFKGLNYKDKLGRLLDVRKKFLPTFREILSDESLSDRQRISQLEQEIRDTRERLLLTQEEAKRKMAVGGVAAIVGYTIALGSQSVPALSNLAREGGSIGLAYLIGQIVDNKLSRLDSKDRAFRICAAKFELLRLFGEPTRS